ncbi:glucocerebrosidase-like protein [Reticulomyxa filosa]|uniref:Glucocerebrosidase-like protein n=1 Tax=Reticulomyxa filosa TaxID=46433 RepID=X6P5U7_RETFI|nr:glucocerebrosidase-like protein [Reticulomyxa filosa]|eukprot:ETO32987.1 glucocerebrosidase-like protein [Reticulomyxa filosa]
MVVCTGAFTHVSALNTYLSEMNANFDKDIYIIATEACTGEGAAISPPKKGVDLGNWNRGTQYSEDVIGDLNCGAVSWVDWNMVLDIDGGPNHANNTCDAPIVVDFDKQMYYKQPMYYMLAHVTRFLRPGSIRVQVQRSDNSTNQIDSNVWVVAGIDATNLASPNRTVLVILNSDGTYSQSLKIVDPRFGYTLLTLPPHSIQTLLWDVQI